RLDVNKEERARRWAKDHKESLSKARRMVYAKDSETMAHFKKTYKKDMDMSVFDIRINCDKITLKEAVSLVSMLALVKEKKLFR
ncbi:MAG: hypothetical protein M1504_01710, partial [Candidatus Marsarchaeota archaeon]|nr:hypothetical protein [Candidatus Marsarchaeota archaeon]